MCRTVHAVLQTAICGIQMLVRVFMTVILMIENVIRMLLQTLYNFISFVLQMVSLIPICIVFLLTARLKCFMCGGGGPCPVNRGGTCDCLMSALAFVILFFIFRATGVLDKIFYSLGYAKARPPAVVRFVPTPGDITECSRNDTESVDMDYEGLSSTPEFTPDFAVSTEIDLSQISEEDESMLTEDKQDTTKPGPAENRDSDRDSGLESDRESDNEFTHRRQGKRKKTKSRKWKNLKTTVMYYLI